jgi:hypothetical protein
MLYLVKILVDNYEHAEVINESLCEAEEQGELDFPFTVRFTEAMTNAHAERELMNEAPFEPEHSAEHKKRIIEKLCELRYQVIKFLGFDHPADCLCVPATADFSDDGVALEFIQKAVREKIERETDVDTSHRHHPWGSS